MKPRVYVLKTKPGTIVEDYGKIMDLANYQKFLPKGKEAIIKLNLSWSLFYPSCSSPPWQLEGVLKKMLEDKYKLWVTENKTVVTDVWKGLKGNKWGNVVAKYNQKFQPLTLAKWKKYKPKHETPAIDKIFPEGLKIPEDFIGKSIIHLPTIKTHGHTQMTGAMKNAFGGLITERRHHSHKMIHEILVDLLQIQKEIHPGIFAVMDGTVCGDGKGPRTMIPKVKDYILASNDQVAIDAVSAKMMGYDPMRIEFIRQAHNKGLGCGDFDQIEVVGEDISNVNFHFKTARSPVIFFDQLFRKKIKWIEPWLFHTGLFSLCIFGSAFYHDYLWYPTIGRYYIDNFMKTGWGKLFREY